jgi:hypothetical protein
MTNKRLAFLISATYVGLATIFAFYSMENLISEGVLFYFFLPANFFAQLIIFTERNPFAWLLISQLVTLGITFLLVYAVISSIKKSKI